MTNGGTIPDRGLFGVFLVDGGGRVGELDEEMVYEARAGQTFLLGASTWRIEEITRDRVLVSPAPGLPGAVPFWKGEGVGRPFELGQKIGAASRELVGALRAKAAERLRDDYHLDERAARNLLTFLREQADATGAVPRTARSSSSASATRSATGASASSRRSAAACTRRGRWRSQDACARHMGSRRSRSGRTTASRCTSRRRTRRRRPRPRARPGRGRGSRRRRAGRHRALRRALPRERGARPAHPAPPAGPAHPAVAAAPEGAVAAGGRAEVRLVPGHPRDVPRVPAGRLRPACAARAAAGAADAGVDLVEVETRASPYSASLLFDYIATYMYEDDTPPAERRAQALSLDRDLLRELLGQEELRDLLDRDAVEDVERRLRGDPRTPDELHDQLRAARRSARRRIRPVARRAAARRTARAARPGRRRGAADRGRGRGPLPRRPRRHAALGASRRVSRRRARLAPAARAPFRQGPRAVHDRRGERALRPRRLVRARGARARRAAPARRASPGRDASASGAIPTCCAGSGARRSPRCAARSSRSSRTRSRGSCRVARRRPARVAARGARPAPGARAAGRAVGVARCCRAACPVTGPSTSTRCARPARSCGSAPAPTGSPSTSARTPPRSAACRAAAPGGPEHDAVRAALASAPLLRPARRDRARGGAALPALWDLVWAGEVTNDAWTPLRAARRFGTPRPERRPRRFSRRRVHAPSATAGRWSRTDRLFAARPTAAPSPSCCSSGTASSRATACAPRGSPAATAPSTPSYARSRRSACAVAATSWKASAARSSRSAARSSGCASCGTPRRRAARARGRRPRAAVRRRAAVAATRGPRAARVAGALVVLARRRAGALRRARRPVARPAARSGGGLAAPRARCAGRARPPRRRHRRLAVERFDGEPSPRATCCRCSSRSDSSRARGARSCVPSGLMLAPTVRWAATPRFPPPQRAVTVWSPVRVAAGSSRPPRSGPRQPTCANAAGTPAKVCVAGNARDMIVTVSLVVQPPATPRTSTECPRCTVRGDTVSATFGAFERPATSSPPATMLARPTPA